MSLRDMMKDGSMSEPPYYEFNREERHLAGILFHILASLGMRERALKALHCDWKINDAEFGMYLEYSYPRDAWHSKGKELKSAGAANDWKRDTILRLLTPSDQTDGSSFSGLREPDNPEGFQFLLHRGEPLLARVHRISRQLESEKTRRKHSGQRGFSQCMRFKMGLQGEAGYRD